LLTSESEVTIKGGMLGRILEPILGPLMRRMVPNALAGFKYLIEHGYPYEERLLSFPGYQRPASANPNGMAQPCTASECVEMAINLADQHCPLVMSCLDLAVVAQFCST
jgi:hypothetical protein